MKFVKALKLIKKICSEKNCKTGKCPLAYKMDYGTDCMISIDNVGEWNPEDIANRLEAYKKAH